jgi:hypothetical protein
MSDTTCDTPPSVIARTLDRLGRQLDGFTASSVQMMCFDLEAEGFLPSEIDAAVSAYRKQLAEGREKVLAELMQMLMSKGFVE